MSETKPKAGVLFWVIAVVALLWNLLGVLGYLTLVYASDLVYSALTPEMRAAYEAMPAWTTAAYAVAVFGGALGSILLLFRSGLATIAFVVSLLGILANDYYSFAMAKVQELPGFDGFVMPVIVIVVALFLVVFSVSMKGKGVLR